MFYGIKRFRKACFCVSDPANLTLCVVNKQRHLQK